MSIVLLSVVGLDRLESLPVSEWSKDKRVEPLRNERIITGDFILLGDPAVQICVVC
jgi:hypothetical protein